jgi:outer membrane protein assembly factor BamB
MMTHNRLVATRRAALLLSLTALSGCSFFDNWFGSDKPPIPGKRLPVLAVRHGLDILPGAKPRVSLPTPAVNADWALAGGVPSHDMGHPGLPPSIAVRWSSDIGAGGDYRRKITAQPVILAGRVFTMDSDAVVSAYDVATGNRAWRLDTQADDDETTNVGGGIGADGTTVYAATGRADLVALDTATGKLSWRVKLPNAARSAPTIVGGSLFVLTIDDQLIALSTKDGKTLWSYQAGASDTTVLGLPAPAVADGLVVAGFGSGELIAFRAAGGTVAWSDSIAAANGRNSLTDLSTIRGRPVIKDGRVYAIGLGGLLVAMDLRTGRRLWEREIASEESPVIAGDWIFLMSTDSQVAALSRADGTVVWVTQLDQYENMEKHRDPIHWIGPVLAGDRLVVCGSDESALALSPYTGAILGKQSLSAVPSLAPVVAGGTLYMVTDDATLSAFR